MVPQLRPFQLSAWIDSLRASSPSVRPVLLDVREPWEWQAASVRADGCVLLQISMGEITRRLEEIAPQTPTACLCHHGARSQRVAAFLDEQGHASVVNIAGGIEAWSNEVDASVPRY